MLNASPLDTWCTGFCNWINPFFSSADYTIFISDPLFQKGLLTSKKEHGRYCFYKNINIQEKPSMFNIIQIVL